MRKILHSLFVLLALASASAGALAVTAQQASASFVAHATYCEILLGTPGHEDGPAMDYGRAVSTVLLDVLEADTTLSMADSVSFVRGQCANKSAAGSAMSHVSVTQAGKAQ